MPDHSLLHKFRSDRKRLPLHPLERAVLTVVALHLCFLPWALGTMHPWSQITSLCFSVIGMGLALIPRHYTADQSGGPEMRLTMWPRLVRFPLFWIGLALLAYITIQGFNPSWVWERNATTWWLRRVNDIPWLPTSVQTPFERFNLWRQFIIYASAWLTACTVWVGFTRRRSLQILLLILVINTVVLAAVGFFEKFAELDSYLFMMKWPPGHTAFASFVYRNHAGAYFGLLTFVALALAIWIHAQGERTNRKSTPASLLSFCAVFITAAVFFSMSRGASLIVSLAWLAMAGWFWLQRYLRPASGATNPVIWTAVVLLFMVVIGATARYINFTEIEARFDSLVKNYQSQYESVQSRLQAHSAASTMLGDHWQRGVGAGDFRYLFPEYIKKYPEVYAGGRFFWEHAHSDWLEIPIELGLTGTLLLLLGGIYGLCVFGQHRTGWHPLVMPVLLGCSQTLIHAWFDFPFQCPAILITWLALIAVSARWLELDAR